MTAVFIISGALLAAGALADPGATAQAPGSPTTNPAAVQYASSADSGQALVSGTSTLHAWTVKSTTIQGNAGFSGPLKADSASTVTLQSIDFSVPVDSLKSTEGSGMDSTMYDALKLKQFPSITFSLTKANLKTAPTAQDPAYHFDATGTLTIAGAARPWGLSVDVLPHDNGLLTVSTEAGMKMSDFGVKPPTAMLGMIKSGDAVTVKVTWQLTTQTAVAGANK